MTERFKRYLEAQFRAISPTKAAMQLRIDTLTQLEEKAQDCRIKGMSDEEAIYNTCIDSLGDFQQKLADFDKTLVEAPKKRAKRNIAALVCSSLAVIAILAYLVLSLTSVIPWSQSWLILVGGIFGCVVAVAAVVSIKSAKKGKFLLPRLCTIVSLVLLFVFSYLVAHMCFNEPRLDWFTFLIMVIVTLGADVAISFITKNKLTIIEFMLWLVISAALVYVMCGVAGVLAWGIGWLLPVCAGIFDIGLAAFLFVYLSNQKKKDSLEKYASIKEQVDEEYYTKW